MKNLKSTYKVLRTDVELDVKEISYLVTIRYKILMFSSEGAFVTADMLF